MGNRIKLTNKAKDFNKRIRALGRLNFETNTRAFQEASQGIQGVIDQMTEDLAKLERINQAIGNFANFLGGLDRIIRAGAKIMGPG